MRRPIRTWRRSTTTSRGSTARRSPIWRRPAAAICRSTRSISPICAIANLRREVANIGEDPATLPQTYAKLLNDTIRDRPRDMTVCMHLCRGNFAGAWVAEGGYEPIAELLFNQVDVDGYFLEYDSARAGGFEPLRFLPKGKVAVLGPRHHQERQAREQGRAQAPHRRGVETCALGAARALAAMRLLQRHRRQHHEYRRRDRQAPPGGRDRARGVGLGVTPARVPAQRAREGASPGP